MLKKVISGGQTGVDQAALMAAKDLDFLTGGWMPKGWKTEDGPRPQFEAKYGMLESAYAEYQHRTWMNVKDSDGTVILGRLSSAGSKFTEKCCVELVRPSNFWFWPPMDTTYDPRNDIVKWVREHKIETLNVAGNRESTNPGVGAWAYLLLVDVFYKIKES